jgi:hypothetical protein
MAGVGIRSHRGLAVYRHGGGWSGIRLLPARIPSRRAGFVIVAPGDETERRVAPTDLLIEAPRP